MNNNLDDTIIRLLGAVGVQGYLDGVLGGYLREAVVILNAVILLAFVAVTVMFLTWMERKVLAHAQSRFGPMVTGPHGMLQPIVDGIKLLTKEDIIPRRADRAVFSLATLVAFVPALIVFVPIPFGKGLIFSDLRVGLLYIIAISAISPVGILMAGWSSNNKYSLMGAVRAVAQDISYEIPLALTALSVVVLAGSLSTVDIVTAQGATWFGVFPRWFIFLQPLGFLVFLIASVAEMGRTPFDLQESESELVAGFFTEYSGMKFAMFFLAEYAHLFAISGVIVTLFLGGWQGPQLPGIPFEILSLIYFLAKVYAVIFFTMWLRATVPRVRVDQLLNLGWKILIPVALLNLLATGFLVLAGVIA